MSWKHYGGLRNLDSYNNISVNNIIADKFTVRDKFLTEFQIIGETQLLGNVTLGDNSSNLIDIKSDMIAERNVDIHGDLNINGKLIITSSGEGFFLLGTDDNRLGVNIENPLAVLDIAGSYESVLNIYSDQSNNRNIIARNYLQNGIAVNTIDASSSSIQFYSGTDISNNKEAPDSEIKYLNGGILEIITGQDTRILSQVSISKDGRIGHIHNETLMVYDISNGTYKNLYYKDDTIIKGSAFSLIAYDSSANTSMNITTPDGKGAVISGGAYPYDTNRSMLILDVSNNSEEKPQALMIVSGTANETYNTTTSINKYISQIGKYSLDVNGATYISDSQIKILEEPKMELLDIRVHNNYGIALGSFSEDGKFYIYYTENGGLTWSNEEFEYGANNTIQTGDKTKVTDIFINDTVKCFVTHAPSSFPSLFYSYRTPSNTLSNWTQFQSMTLNDPTENASAVYNFLNNSIYHFIVARDTKLNILSVKSNIYTSASLNFNIKDSKGYENIIYVVGEGGNIKSYTVDSTVVSDSYTATNVFTERTYVSYNGYPNKTYTKVFVYNANTIIAIGNGIITYTHNGGSNWYTNLILEGGTDITMNDIHIKSENEAIVVGDNGIIYVTHDGYRTWTQLSKDYINGGGTGEYLIGDTSNNITSVTMSDDNTFITTHLISQAIFDANDNITTPYPESKLLYTYAPSIFNRYNKSTLDVIGSLNVSGDLVLHDRGELKTTDVSFGLLKTNTRQIEFGLSGEIITIGAKTGLVDLNGRLQVTNDVSFNSNAFISSNLYLSGDASLNSDLFINGDISANSKLNLGGDASLNSKLFISGDISANSNFYLGGDASLNSDLFIKGDISANSNFYLGGDASLNSKLFISGDIAANSNFYLTGDASLNSDVFIKGDISANSNFYLSGDASLNSDVFVKGDISANSNLYLGGDASLNSDLFISGDISANSKLYLGGDASLKSDLFISGDISANSKLNLGGDASLKSKLFIGGDISANSKLNLGGDASLKSKLFICGDISANSKLNLGGDASLKSKLFIGGDISANSDLKLGGDAILYSNLDVGGNLDIGGNTLITGSLTVDGNLNFRGELSKTDISHNVLISDQLTVRNIAEDEVALIVRQDTGISSIAEFKRGNTTKVEIKNNGDIYMNSDLKIMNTTTSISGQNSTAGALYVKGGTRMDGNLNVMGDTHFEGDITFVGTVTSLSVVENAILTITSDNINNNKFTYNGVPLDDSQASNFNINGGANFNDSIDVSNIIYGNKINMSGDVSFNSNAFINSNLYLNGDASLNSKLFISGDISANSKLNLGGDASLKSKLFVNGDISANTNFFLGGDALFNSKLFISGDISANSNIYLGGDASLNSKLFVNSDISANSNFYLGGDASLNSKLFISGDISANSNLYLGGDASLNSKLFVNGDISANSNLYLGGDASLNSKLFISGDISANTNFFLGGDALLNSKLFIKGDISANSNFFLGGDASLNSKLFVNGDISANSNFFLGGDASLNSKLFINGDISANSNLYLGGDALLSSNLIINGDISANSNIYLGGDASLNSKLFVNGDISANTNFFLGGDASLNSKLFIKGDISANSNIYLGGDALLSSNLIISGDISANSNLYLGGDASLNSKLFVNGDISANTNLYLGGDASLNSKLFVSGQTKLGTVYNSGVPLYVDGSGAMRIPVGTTENRPSTDPGLIRFNTTDATFEGYDGSNWGSLGGVSNSDKSSRIYISDASAIVFETNSIIRETIDNSGNISFDLGYGNINMNQKGTATILEIADSSNNNEIRIQNQDDIFKLIYDQSGNETSRIHMTNNEISLYPRYPTSSMLINHNGALIGNDSELSEQLRDTDWRRIGYSSANGTNMGNTVSISRDGKRVAFGEYAVNSTDASSNVHIYTVTEREMRHLYTIKIDGGNVSSIDLNEDGTIIIIGKHNTVPNGQIELWEYNGTDYVQVGSLQSGTTNGAQLGHTTSINNDGTIFAAGQYTNDAGKPGIEGGVLIFNYIGDSITKIADISMNNDGTDDLYNQMGRSIELNGVGDRIVIGGTIDKTISGYPVYRVYVYQKQVNGTWNQVLDIINTTLVGTNFGISVAMSNDGKVISVATQESLATGVTELYGQVLVYDLLGEGLGGSVLTSSLRGSPIKLTGINDDDTFGSGMSLNNDGTVLAIGTGSHNNFNGQASIYKYLNSNWTIVKTINGTTNSNLGGIHDYDMASGQLISDEDGICIDGTGDLVIIGAPNLFTVDNTPGSGNGQVYLYRNQTYTLGVNKKLRVKGDVAVDNGTLDVSGNIIVSGSGINKIISDNYGIGNHIQSTNAGGRNVFEGGSNYIYSQDMGNGDTGGYNRLYATQTNGYNYINATGSGGTNYIEANISGSNRLKVNGVDKIITEANTTTLTNDTININGETTFSQDMKLSKSGVCNLTIHSTTGDATSLYLIRNSAIYGVDNLTDYRLYVESGKFKLDSAYTPDGGGVNFVRNWISIPSYLDAQKRMKLGDNAYAYDGLDLFCGTGDAKLKLESTTTTLTNTNINMIGNVGIGTTNPGSMLDVRGDVNFDDKIKTVGTTTTLTNTSIDLKTADIRVLGTGLNKPSFTFENTNQIVSRSLLNIPSPYFDNLENHFVRYADVQYQYTGTGGVIGESHKITMGYSDLYNYYTNTGSSALIQPNNHSMKFFVKDKLSQDLASPFKILDLQKPNVTIQSDNTTIKNPILVAGGHGTYAIATSIDNGLTWTGVNQSILDVCESVVYNGTLWVAVGNGPSYSIMTSYDGTNWTGVANSKTLIPDEGLNVAWNGYLFVAGATAENAPELHSIVTSFNGTTWTGRGKSILTYVSGVGWNGSYWVAVGSGTLYSIMTSYDGTTWTGVVNSLGIFSTGGQVAWSPSLSLWVAVGFGTYTIATSANGTTWTAVSNSKTTIFTGYGSGITWCADLSLFVAGGNGTSFSIATSANGTTWTGVVNSNTIFSAGGTVAWNGYQFIMMGEGNFRVATSPDGTTWTGRTTSVFTISAVGVAYGASDILRMGGNTTTLTNTNINMIGNVGIGVTNPGEKLVVKSVNNTNTTVNILTSNNDNVANNNLSTLNLCGDDAVQWASGMLYMGASSAYGGGITFKATGLNPNAELADGYISMFRRTGSGTDTWTMRNNYNTNDWEFRGDVKSATMNTTGDVNFDDKIKTVGTTTTLTNGTNTLTATTLQNKLTSSVTTGVVNYITATGGGDNKLQATTGQNMLTSARATGVANYIEATGGGDNKIQSTGNNTMISSITSGIANRIEASSGGYNYMTANTNQIYSTSSSGYNRIQAVNYNSIQGKNTYIDISNNNGGSLFVRNWTNNTDQINNESRIIMSAYTNNGASMTTLGQITCQPEYNVPGNPHGTMNFDVWSYDSGWALKTQMRILSGGNVGIGTTNPGAKLEITTPEGSTQIETLLKLSHGTLRPKFNFQSVNNGYGWSYNTGFIGHGMSLSPVAGQKITCQSDSSSIYSSGIAFSGGAGLRFYTNQVVGGGANTDYTATTIERMRIANDGNVGIGTTNPNFKTQITYAGADAINYGFNIQNSTATGASNRMNLVLFTDNNSTQGAMGGYRKAHGTDYYGGLVFYIGSQPSGYNQGTPSTPTEATNSLTEAMRITHSGNVGIGTTDPKAKLHVDGEIRVKQNCIRLQNNWSNFGVGARIPITKSSATDIEMNEINGSIGSDNDYTTYDTGFLRLSAGGGTSTTNKSYIDLYGYNSNIITFGTEGVERMVVDSAGNVGIGTTDPGEKLDVVGAVKATSYYLDNDSNENKIRLYGNGDAYAIGLATGNAFGGLTQAQWSMTFKVSSADNDNRGFLWKRSDHTASQGAMSLTAKGNLNVASNTRIGYGTSSTTLPSGAMLDVNGTVKATSFSGDGSALTGIVSTTAAALTSGNKTITGTLNISGDVTTGNTLYIGTNDNSQTVSKTIYFGGTYGDNAYTNCVIENRIYETGTEKRELLLFSGNDIEGSSGPDRIRLKGGNIRFDTYNAATDVRTTETTKMIIDQDGNVGIGTTNPGAKLHIATNSVNIFTPNDNIGIHDEATALLITSDGDLQDVNNISFAMKMVSDTNSLISPNGKLNFYANAGSANNNSGLTPNNLIMSLVGNGNVGIGTTNPGAKLEVSGGGILVRRILNSSNQIGEILTMQVIQDTISIRKYSIKHLSDAQGNFRMGIFSQNYSTDVDTERFTLKGGNVGIGTTDPGSKLDVNGTVSATSFNATSDIRVKTNIQTIVLKTALDQINQLEPKSYQFYDNDTTHYGLIAQEAEQIIPEAVISDGSRMIPSIGEICKLINGGKTIVLDTKTTKDMVPTKLEFDDISGNKQSVGIESLEGDKYIHLKESIEQHLNNGLTVFVHGHEVKDFRSINYNTILAVSIAATKELSKELGQTRAELGQTRAELGQTRAELNALKELVNQLINK